jgi:hypothetical protein
MGHLPPLQVVASLRSTQIAAFKSDLDEDLDFFRRVAPGGDLGARDALATEAINERVIAIQAGVRLGCGSLRWRLTNSYAGAC